MNVIKGLLEDCYSALSVIREFAQDDVVQRRPVFLFNTLLSMVAIHDREIDRLHKRIEGREARTAAEVSP